MRQQRIYTVSPGRPFLRALARAMLSGDLPVAGGPAPTPISLSQATILLPTRRAARALQDAFLVESNGAALLLPKIRPIAEGLEELSVIADAAGLDGLDAAFADIPPAVNKMQRQLALTDFVLRWSGAMRAAHSDAANSLAPVASAGAGTPAQAVLMAKELSRLMDLVETEGVSLAGLAALVPEEFSEHWAKTIDFLKIVVEVWPAYLAEQGVLSAVDRRNRVIRAEAARLEALPPAGPVIVAGVTGSIPATAELMRTVAALAQGAIVLPALDLSIDDAAFATLTETSATSKGQPEHPQFGLARLLKTLGVSRADVQELPGGVPSTRLTTRLALIGEAMRPAGTTDRWHHYAATVDRAAVREGLAGLHLIEAPNAQDEAETVALILREALETPGRTAALISPDRMLARRVGVRLQAWGVMVDDSAGRPLAKTVPGAMLDLIVETIAQDFAPAPLMALLKHPLTRLGLPAAEVRRAARNLELAAFRTVYLGRGLDGVDAALERARMDVAGDGDGLQRRARSVQGMWDEDWAGARDLVTRLKAAFAPWQSMIEQDGQLSLRMAAMAHAQIAEALGALPVETSAAPVEPQAVAAHPVWAGEAGQSAQSFFTALADEALHAPAVKAEDYPDVYRSLVAGENVRPRVAVHPRLSIWGPFEARLQQPDVVVLGSLNEGTWPKAGDPGPWLNRPMRQALGLPSPEEAIGHAAHDFTSQLGASRIYLTRALKMDGVPTVPSRWLMRLSALLAGVDATAALKPDKPWLGYARARDAATKGPSISAPMPRPDVKLRPRRLSVTQVERWIANPYSIFASHILQLDPLAPLGRQPDASLKGTIVHAALGRFAQKYPEQLPNDIAGALLDEARNVLSLYSDHPRVAAFWLPRFERFAHWFATAERERRVGVSRVFAEVSGRLVIAAPEGAFTLTARADRVDLVDGGLAIIDYKTGSPPTKARVESGVSPQLPLEAAIAAAGGFANVAASPVTELGYVRVTGGEPPGELKLLDIANIAGLANGVIGGLSELVGKYDQKATPYKATRRAAFAQSYDYDDFAHLARVAEWSRGDDSAEG